MERGCLSARCPRPLSCTCPPLPYRRRRCPRSVFPSSFPAYFSSRCVYKEPDKQNPQARCCGNGPWSVSLFPSAYEENNDTDRKSTEHQHTVVQPPPPTAPPPPPPTAPPTPPPTALPLWQVKVEEWLFDDIRGCKVESGKCVCVWPILWVGPEGSPEILETIPEDEEDESDGERK